MSLLDGLLQALSLDSPASDPPASESPPSSSPAPDSPASSPTPLSLAPDDDDCAKIPTAPHAVLTAEITLFLVVPYPIDQAIQMSHTFTLTGAEGSYASTLALASDCVAGNADGTCIVTFRDLTEGDTYSLRCDDGTTTYPIFEELPYVDISEALTTSAAYGDCSLEWDTVDGRRMVVENGSFDDVFEKVEELSGSDTPAPPSDDDLPDPSAILSMAWSKETIDA